MSITGIGQRIFKVFTVVNVSQRLFLPACDNNQFDCNFILPAFVSLSDDNDLKNDKFSFLGIYQNWTTAVDFTLQKKVNGIWTDQDTITDDSYGEFYALGYFTGTPKATGFILYWQLVVTSFGFGNYRVKIEETATKSPAETFTREVCVKDYGCGEIDNTVRLEWYNNTALGDIDNNTNVVNFNGLDWYSQYRLPNSFFGHPSSTYETEETQYTNGEIKVVKEVQEEKYILITGGIPSWLHNTIKTYGLQSDRLLITDYSSNNPQEIVKKQVTRTSSYEPRYKKGSKCAPVTVEFKPSINRLERFRCL